MQTCKQNWIINVHLIGQTPAQHRTQSNKMSVMAEQVFQLSLRAYFPNYTDCDIYIIAGEKCLLPSHKVSYEVIQCCFSIKYNQNYQKKGQNNSEVI